MLFLDFVHKLSNFNSFNQFYSVYITNYYYLFNDIGRIIKELNLYRNLLLGDIFILSIDKDLGIRTSKIL